MKVLVSAASKHGATSEIAEEIGKVVRETLEEHGVLSGELSVDVSPPEQAGPVEDYDAVVLGSAVYAGHWLKSAREFAERYARALSERPTWIFSSGPIGEPPKPAEDPVDAAPLLTATGARNHQVFAGKLERGSLGFAEKAVALALRAPEGDFRDWEAVREWAREIARDLARRERGASGADA